MLPQPLFSYAEAILFWAACAWVFWPELRLLVAAGRKPDAQDAGTSWLIDTGTVIALALAFAVSYLPWLIIPYPRLALYAGGLLIVGGSLLRRSCFRTLGPYFTAAVRVVPGQPVIERGPYRWVRHPSYAAGIVMFVGFGVTLGSWLSAAILFVVSGLLLGHRVRVEERALLETLGEPYRAYMARTRRFIPFIF